MNVIHLLEKQHHFMSKVINILKGDLLTRSVHVKLKHMQMNLTKEV